MSTTAVTYGTRIKGGARNAYNKVKSSAKNTYSRYKTKAKAYGQRLDVSYTKGYRRGYNDALIYDKFTGSYAAGAYGYYRGVKDKYKQDRIKKRLSD